MTLALVFAMSGGAWAASKFVITSTKQIKPSVLKQLQGKAGPAGAPGAAGPAGAAGAGTAGAQGPAGPAGTAGKEGPAGTAGKDGKEGKAGKEGSPWTELGTVPVGKTVKGEWSAAGYVVEGSLGATTTVKSSVSFVLPLPHAPEVVHYINATGKERIFNKVSGKTEEITPRAGCTGSVTEPGAEEGNLCIFAKVEENAKAELLATYPLPLVCAWENECNIEEAKASPLGFGIEFFGTAKEEEVSVNGTWAVTAK